MHDGIFSICFSLCIAFPPIAMHFKLGANFFTSLSQLSESELGHITIEGFAFLPFSFTYDNITANI